MQENLPKGWKIVKLGDVCDINPPKPGLTDESSVTFLPMNAVSDNGEILNPQIKLYKDVQKGYTGFVENDVLFAKITPCMENGKGAIARDLNNSVGFGSTEFHVIRPSRKILPEIIFRYLSLKHIRKFAAANMTGSAGQKRVPQSFLNAVKIPLPPLPTQYKLVEILEEADDLRKLRQKADKKMQDLIPSLFVQMFGDPATNPKGWDERKLGEICEFIYGDSLPEKKRNKGDTSVYGSNGIVGTHNKAITEGETIIIGRKGSVGEVNFSKVPCFPIDTTYFIDRRYTKENFTWLFWILKFLKLDKLSLMVGVPGLNRNDAYKLSIPLPPLHLQQEFAERVEEIETEKARQAESKKKLDELFNSLMQRAFKGELVA